MRTTIVVEDAVAGPSTAPEPAAQAPVNAGAGPVAGADGAPAGVSDDLDGGTPPAWLIDEIAAAGGMTAPASPEGIELAGRDAGAAPPA